MEDQLPPPTATTGDLMASPDPGLYTTTGKTSMAFRQLNSGQQFKPVPGWTRGLERGTVNFSMNMKLTCGRRVMTPHLQSKKDNTPVSADSEQFSRQERLRMLALRKHIDSLSNEVSNKESQVQTTREELKKCRSTIKALESEQDEIYKDIEESGESGNTANVYRLESKHRKVCIELEAERALEMQLMEGWLMLSEC
ncbi:hypothetical protein BSL78_04865 [Apostichopus japonicus]|uniref:Uncharacterized protein n=1 Tax=Stichopus japonicus TaxID=307972 RepID=A0A2G8LD82_STIJA|nr:hypothetical protein BSL78_04865 [Apostichopus japonicus]